jgi:signal transduction histidine kinase
MSHDIRTPLNGVIGFTDIALHEKDPSRLHDELDKIRSSEELLQDLVNDILDMSRIESGKMTLEPQSLPSKTRSMKWSPL